MDNDPLAQLMQRLMALQATFQANMAERAEKFGLSVTQAAVAQDLGQHPGSSLQDVCHRLGWPKSTVSRTVDDLVIRGIAVREIPETNRRTVLLSLNHEAMGCVPENYDGVFPGGTPDAAEVQSLVASLEKLLALLKKKEN